MMFCNINNIEIAGIASAVPKQVIEIDSFKNIFGADFIEEFKKETGIKRLHKSVELQTASDLGYTAAMRILTTKNIAAEDIGAVLFVSKTPDYRSPATACVLHHRLGLRNDCLAYDVNLGGTGFINGLNILSSLLDSLNTKYGLMIVGDTTSKQISSQNNSSAISFGDGASAILLEKKQDAEKICIVSQTFSKQFKEYIIQGGGFRFQTKMNECASTHKGYQQREDNLHINKDVLTNLALSEAKNIVTDYLQNNHLSIESFDCFLFNQFSRLVINELVNQLRLPLEKVPVNIEEYGNTCGNSIPLLVADKFGAGESKCIRILAIGFGEGLSLGLADFTLNTENIFPVIETDDYFHDGGISRE